MRENRCGRKGTRRKFNNINACKYARILDAIKSTTKGFRNFVTESKEKRMKVHYVLC